MEKVKTIEKVLETKQHYFYCDKCEALLGFSNEYEDGYYEKLGEVEEKMYIHKDWFKLNKTFCENCKKEFYEELIKKLESIGFK